MEGQKSECGGGGCWKRRVEGKGGVEVAANFAFIAVKSNEATLTLAIQRGKTYKSSSKDEGSVGKNVVQQTWTRTSTKTIIA